MYSPARRRSVRARCGVIFSATARSYDPGPRGRDRPVRDWRRSPSPPCGAAVAQLKLGLPAIAFNAPCRSGLLRERPVVGSCCNVIWIQPDRRGKVRHRLGQIALPAPEFAARVMNIGLRRIEPQHAVIVGDGAVDHVLAFVGHSARGQRLDAVGLSPSLRCRSAHRRYSTVLSWILRKGGGETERGIDPQILIRFDAGCRCIMCNRGPQQRSQDQIEDGRNSLASVYPGNHILYCRLILASDVLFRQRPAANFIADGFRPES